MKGLFYLLVLSLILLSSCEKPKKPKAEFCVSIVVREIGVSLDFLDLSDYEPDSWLWDFGDGNTSAERDPRHTYSSEGIYTVSLCVSNSCGSDTETKTDYITVVVPPIINEDGVTDYDGNTYSEVKIGTQIWMAENLKSIHYTDGTAIPLVTNNTTWVNLANNDTDKAYCFYNNDESLDYGVLYTFAAATNGDNSGPKVQGICPEGWHLPSKEECTLLENFISEDGHNLIGPALKSTIGWNDYIHVSTDDYGFSALPSGCRNIVGDGIFCDDDYYFIWWCSTENESSNAWAGVLADGYNSLSIDSFTKSSGLSVRCIRD